MTPWQHLTDLQQLDVLAHRSHERAIAIFKHSTRCSISSIAKARLDDDWNFQAQQLDIFYLDLLNFRHISNEIAQRFDVHHESPQILLIKNGECVYDASHLDISVGELADVLNNLPA